MKKSKQKVNTTVSIGSVGNLTFEPNELLVNTSQRDDCYEFVLRGKTYCIFDASDGLDLAIIMQQVIDTDTGCVDYEYVGHYFGLDSFDGYETALRIILEKEGK